jgi:hypothetical protein
MNMTKYQYGWILMPYIQSVARGAYECTAYRRRNESKYCQYETIFQNIGKICGLAAHCKKM